MALYLIIKKFELYTSHMMTAVQRKILWSIEARYLVVSVVIWVQGVEMHTKATDALWQLTSLLLVTEYLL